MSDDMFYCSFVSIHYIICECGETFPTEEELKGHLEKDHSLKKEKKEFKCGVCEAIFSTEAACIEHYGANHIEVKQEQSYIEEHSYVDEHDYVEHQDYVVEDTGDGEGDAEEAMIFEHVIEERPLTDGEVLTVKPKKDKKSKPYYNAKNIVCEVCGKRYASNAALKYHQRVHTGERPYKCTECSKSFTMPLFLQIHTRTHTGERPYECGLCPKAFSNKAALLRHDRVHTGIKPYECPECGKFFTQSNSMKLHVNTVHLKMPAPYKSKSRRNKAAERAQLREAILRRFHSEDSSAVQSISETSAPDTGVQIEHFIKPEVSVYKPEVSVFKPEVSVFKPEVSVFKQEVSVFKQEVEETEILYDDVDPREITYEVVYE